MANKIAASMGYGTPIGFAVVLSLQVLLYGFWSGLAQKAKNQRAELQVTKKSLKRGKKS